MRMVAAEGNRSSAKTYEEAKQKRYQFWDTQPVPKLGKFYFFAP